MLKNKVIGQADRLIFGFGYQLVDVEVVTHRGLNPILEGEPGLPETPEAGEGVTNFPVGSRVILAADLPGDGHRLAVVIAVSDTGGFIV